MTTANNIPPLFNCVGILMNTFTKSFADKKTGEIVSKSYVQILGQVPLQQKDQFRLEVVDLKVDSLDLFKQFSNKRISVSVAFFASGDESYPYIPRGSVPILYSEPSQKLTVAA